MNDILQPEAISKIWVFIEVEGPLISILIHTLMDMHTELKAVPHASLRNPNPERSRRVLKNLGVCKKR